MSFSDEQYEQRFRQLLTDYRADRPEATVTEDDLQMLMLLFPGIMVAQADGFIDTTEMVYLVQLSRDLAKTFSLSPSDGLKNELRYLTRNTAFWFEPFMNVLKFYIAATERAMEVADIMILVANCSSGDLINNVLFSSRGAARPGSGLLTGEEEIPFLSDTEREDIKRLANKLGLYNHKEAAERLTRQLESSGGENA